MQTLKGSIKTFYPDFEPDALTSYTFRYIFYRKSALSEGQRDANFSVVTDLWESHEKLFARILEDDDVSSCLAEYVCEFDSKHTGNAYLVKEKEKEEK